jgi:hypothetical protein
MNLNSFLAKPVGFIRVAALETSGVCEAWTEAQNQDDEA